MLKPRAVNIIGILTIIFCSMNLSPVILIIFRNCSSLETFPIFCFINIVLEVLGFISSLFLFIEKYNSRIYFNIFSIGIIISMIGYIIYVFYNGYFAESRNIKDKELGRMFFVGISILTGNFIIGLNYFILEIFLKNPPNINVILSIGLWMVFPIIVLIVMNTKKSIEYFKGLKIGVT